MLMLLQINPRFLLYRVKGTNEIKRMLRNQLKLPTQVLRFFATINPLWLKAEILYRWLDESKSLQKLTSRLCGEECVVDWIHDRTANHCDKLAQELANSLEQNLLKAIYLNGSQCQGCDKAQSIDGGKSVCFGCAGMDAAARSGAQQYYYQLLRNANKAASTRADVQCDNAFCPAAQSAYRLYWRLRHAYAPMLVGYIVARGSAEPGDTTCWRKANAAFDRWYLRQVDSLRRPQHDDLNREAIAFMLDFREHGVDLWYWLNQSSSINKPDDVYFRQYEYLARQKKTLRDTEALKEHNYDKWRSTPFADPNDKCFESFMEEDAIRDVANCVNNRQYTPHLYLKHNEDIDSGKTGGYEPAWYAIDFFSDLKMILEAHQYAVMKEEQRRDEDVKAAGL